MKDSRVGDILIWTYTMIGIGANIPNATQHTFSIKIGIFFLWPIVIGMLIGKI